MDRGARCHHTVYLAPGSVRDVLARVPALMVPLLAALAHERQREITDTLVDPLIAMAYRIGPGADRKVTQELNAFKRVSGVVAVRSHRTSGTVGHVTRASRALEAKRVGACV